MDRVAKSESSPDDRARAAARYALAFGDVDSARYQYASRLRTGSASVDLTIDAIEFEMSQRDLDRASALLSTALNRFPDDRRIARARLELAALRVQYAGKDDDGRAMDALIDALAADPTSRRQSLALRSLRESQRTGHPTPELATRLAALADADASSIELARQAIGAALATSQPQLAGDLARRLLATGGTRVDAVALAAQTLFQVRDYPASRRAAERWRMMAGTRTTDADIALARIALAEDSPARAIKALDAHRPEIAWEKDATLPVTLAEALARAGREGEAYDLLDPALASVPAARSAWTKVAARSADVEEAVKRLEYLELATPSDGTDERVRLAGAFLDRAQAAPMPQAIARGTALLTPLEASGRLSGNARALLAELQRASGDAAAAETTLRDALLVEPDNAMVKNSLAYLLITKPGNAAEACRLAETAVAAAPRQAAFRDTLARALVAADQPERAEAAFREALRIDENLLDAWLGLARLQTQLGRTSDAVASMRRVEATLAATKSHQPPTHLREELRTVRQTVATTHE